MKNHAIEAEALEALKRKLRRVLDKESLDAVHLDLIGVLSTHCSEEMFDLLLARNPYLRDSIRGN